MSRWIVPVALTVVLSACSGPAAEEPARPETPAASSPAAEDASPAPITPDQVAGIVERSVREATRATVSIDTAGVFSFDGVADYTDDGLGSLKGRLDIRQSDRDSTYETRDGRVVGPIPTGMDVPTSTATEAINPWGFAMARVDPTLVAVLIRQFAERATEFERSSGREFRVTLRGPELLEAFGYPRSSFMPDLVEYLIALDDAGRLIQVVARFDRYGNASAMFSDWQAAAV